MNTMCVNLSEYFVRLRAQAFRLTSYIYIAKWLFKESCTIKLLRRRDFTTLEQDISDRNFNVRTALRCLNS